MIGMTVLVVFAVAVLSWLLETEPRPLPTEVRIVADAASEPVATVRAAEPAPVPPVRDRTVVSPVAPTQPARETAAGSIKESLGDDEVVVEAASRPVPAKPPVTVAVAKPAVNPSVKPPAKPVAPPAPVTKPASAKPVSATASKPDAAVAPATRYVVQVGAFADVAAARATRLKVEALGIKTYTQVVQTPAGRKIRVRMGPYASEAEAQKVLTAARKAGLVGGILTF